MIPLFRKVKTQEEKTALVRLARAIYDAVPIEHQHLFASSDADFLSNAAENIEIAAPAYVQPRDLTASELAAQDGRLNCMKIFGERADDPYQGLPSALTEMAKANDAAELAKLVAPARRAETFLEKTIREALAKGAHVPRRESEREGLVLPLRKRSSGERIEFDAEVGECTLYVDGAFKGCWKGAPSDRPHSFA